jgi:hypothetical protein
MDWEALRRKRTFESSELDDGELSAKRSHNTFNDAFHSSNGNGYNQKPNEQFPTEFFQSAEGMCIDAVSPPLIAENICYGAVRATQWHNSFLGRFN